MNANWGEGIDLAETSGGYVGYNRVNDNYSVNIYLDNAQYVTIDNNTVNTQNRAEYFRDGKAASGSQMANEAGSGSNSPLTNNTVKNNKVYRCSYGICYGNYESGGGMRYTEIFGNYVEACTQFAASTDAATHTGSGIYNTFKVAGGTSATRFLGTDLQVYSNIYE